MGRLVKANPEVEASKGQTTVVGTGTHGRLVRTGDVQRTSHTGNVVQKRPTAQPSRAATAPTKASSPMFRTQQNVVTPKNQSALAQNLAKGALQQQEAKNYQSEKAFNQHVKDVKPQTVAQRVGNTIKGATKTYGAGVTNAVGLAQTGSGLQRRGEAEKEIALWDQDIKAQRDVLADPSSTESERETARTVITNLEARKAAYRQAYGIGGEVERTAGAIYKAADRLADSGAKDINKAKSGLGKVGQLAVDTGVAGTQMAEDIALSPFMFGTALFPMAIRSMGSGAQEARRQGATHEQQVNYGFASGALSVATEKIGNAAAPFKKMFGRGFLDGVIERTMSGLNNSAAGKIALSFIEEGGEEAIEDLIQPALQMIYNGKTLGGSYSELEASEILNDFLVGGILGGLGGGVEAIGNRGGRYYDSRTELPETQTETRSDAEIVNGIADRLFARYDSMIGESGRKAIRGSYQEGKDTAEHVKDFIPAYNAGVEGKANPNPTNETAYAGYVAGQNDAKAEARKKTFAQESDGGSGLVYDDYVSREMDSATADEINTVAKALGVRVRMADAVRGGTANGVIEGNEIRIAKDAQDPVMQVVGHEWTHRVQELAPEQYTAFRDAIMEDPDVAEAANILYEQYNRMGVEISADEALDEAAANYAGEMIANTDVLNEFIRRHSEDRTLLEKLRDAIHEIVGKLTGKAKQQAQTVEGKLQAAFEAASKQAESLQNRQTNGTISETRYAAKSKYWRPNLTQKEWSLLNRHMEQEIADSIHTLDEATQWAYASEKGNQVFAIYGIGDGTEATPLYAVGGKKAAAQYEVFKLWMEGSNGEIDRNRKSLDRIFENIKSKSGRAGNNVSAAERGAAADGNVRISLEERGGNGTANSESGPENRRVSTRFSLKAPVEETDKLIAVHNKDEASIMSALKLGGLPMPSIAIVKARDGHTKYGPISLVFSKDTIDPQLFRANKVYGGDAWTPTAPRVDYPVNSKKASQVEHELHRLAGDVSVAGGIFGNSAALRSMGIDDTSTRSTAELAEKLASTDTVRAAYLADQGKSLEPVKMDKVWDKFGNDTLQKVVDRLGVNTLAEIEANLETGESVKDALGENAEVIRDILRDYYREQGEPMLRRMAVKRHWTDAEINERRQNRIDNSMDGVSIFTLEDIVHHAWDMYQDGGATKGEIDRMATSDALRSAVDGHAVEEWIAGKLDGLLGEAGIYNGKDPYTPSGNLRSFSQLHYAYTLENIVKAMKEGQEERGGNTWGASAKTLQSVATPEYRSIQEIKADSGRLGMDEGAEYEAKLQAIDDQIGSIITKIKQGNKAHSDNSFVESDIIGSILMETSKGKRTVDAIMRAFSKEGYKISSQTAQDIQAVYQEAAEMPTGYFEAKPQRAVGFDEVLTAVIPDNSSDRLKAALQDAGVNTVEYIAGDEADRLAKVNSVDDAKFSLKGTENAQEIAALKRENETLRQRVDYWKGQTRRSDGVRTDSKSVEKAAKELTRRYGEDIDSGEIAGDLASLYDYIARGGDETGELTYTEARNRADAIAQRIAESAIAKDDEVYREYSELRKYLKDTKITLSAEDAAGVTDYADFRRGLFGKVDIGKGERTNVDQVYSELAESYPEFFSETRENNVSDQISRIAEVANELYNVGEYNPFEGYMGQAVSAISNDIMERFFDLPQAKKTFADVQAEKLDAAKAAGRKAAADAKLAGQMAQGRTDAVRLRHTQEALQKARAQQAEKLDALKNRYREKDATRREGQKRRELRAKITRHAKDLSKKLLRPTDAKHIPENMRSAVAAVLNSINQESAYTVDESGKRVYDGSGTPTQRTEAFRALQEQYQAILKDNEGGDMVIDPSLLGTDGSDGLISQVVKMGDRRLSELTREELGTMWKTIRAVEKSVSTAGKVLSKSKFETTKQMADAFKTDVSTRRKKLGGNTTISLETPYTFFAHYGETGKSIYRMLRNAQDSQEIMARDIAEKTRKVLGDELGEAGFKDIAGKAIHGDLKGALRDARGSAIGKWEAETHDITVANGGKLTLTTPQIMELYLLSKRKQALGHLLGGGVIQPEIKSAETGRTKVPRGTQQVFLTDGDIERITGKLTDEQKRVADGLQELTATTLAKYGNDASMQAYGYRKFTEKNYWPIKSAKEALHSNLEKDSGNVRSIKNIGMAQQVTPNANNAVELRSVFDTFADHASDMIDYAAWLAPMEDANRFFNFQYRNDAGNKTGVSVKGLLDEKGGNGAQQYWQKLMGDIQNGIGVKDFEPGTDKMGKFVGKFKGASVGANIRVVIQQPTAFFRAAAVLDPKDMAKGMTGGVTKGSGWEKALEHSPIAMRKDVGSFDISSPYTLKDRFYGKEGVTNKLNDLAGAAAGKADTATWGKLWNACEWQVKRENPDVRAGSNEFYRAVNDVFSDMIDQTQVVDGILQRSNIMRGKSTLSQQATAFMGEPIMSLNVLLRSYDNFRYEENPAKRSKALKTLGRAATALVVTNVVNALAQSIVDGLRDDDRDKDYGEKFLSAFTGVEGDEKNALELIGNVVLNGNVGSNMNPVAQIPFAKDVLSLAQGYDVSRPDMEVFSDLINAARAFVDSAGGDGKKTRKEATLTLLAAASKMFGLPVANIKRDLMATLRTIAQASGSLGFQYEVEKFSYNLANSGNRSRFIGILYDALEQGDYATYEHVRRDLMEQMGLDGESIQSSLKTRYNKKAESEANYLFPQKSLDLLGIRGKYAYDSGEDEEKFSAADLNASSYSKYETQKGDAYRTQADKATSSGAFSRLSDEGKDKALGYVESYAEAVALKENSGGQYEITTKWIQNAQEAQKQYRIAPGVFAACKAAASECEMLKDKDGDSIDYSKGLQIMEMLFRSGLNEQQRTAMYEYLDVPKKIRHWNRARVDEQLAIARKKAA